MNKLLTFGEFIKLCTDLATVTGFKEEMFNSVVCFDLEGFQIPVEAVSWDIEKGRVIIHETKILSA